MNNLEILLTIMNIIFFITAVYIHVNMYSKTDESSEENENGEAASSTPKCDND